MLPRANLRLRYGSSRLVNGPRRNLRISRGNMTEQTQGMVVKSDIAQPLHLQQYERSVDISTFLDSVEEVFKEPDGDEIDASSTSENELAGVDSYTGETIWNGVAITKQDRISDKLPLYNLGQVGPDRQWLQEILLSDSSDSSDEEITEEDVKLMLKDHVLKKKYKERFYRSRKKRQYQYYSAGLFSNYDKFPEHQITTAGISSKKKRAQSVKKEKPAKQESVESPGNEEIKKLLKIPPEDVLKPAPRGRKSGAHKKKVSTSKTAEIMAHRRRKIFANMAKKEIGKYHRSKVNNHKELITCCKRVANLCVRHCRQRAFQSQKCMKEIVWRSKRLSKEMQLHWKRFERVERETRRRLEKEAEEQRKMDVELMEAKRQQRKLNFLITQTELYAHFMSRKLGAGSAEDKLRILNQLEEEANPRLAAMDDYDCEAEKEKVMIKVEKAFSVEEEERAKEFGLTPRVNHEAGAVSEELPQPGIFRGTLKGYQIKGMTWLVNLYDQGINGILADEMGLGKTVQSIAFLCHIAEKYSVWGPFLIISPVSTLHNWQQEMQRFVPDFKVIPYWGSQQERKILRQFWDQKGLHTKDASFHVVITSYQLVITDLKYFNRVKWQYLILDEAQAIKSTTSTRWKVLLGFNCRNRLLLSGTPIQNSMAELWALLHFIMPSMFDSHDEFNEWFSKDIESHAEHKTNIDERHLSRLHMILKPFMLRRVKTDVENELSDKIEIMVYCPLTTRQKMLYSALKKKIKIEDLLHSSTSSYQAQSITSNLMNLVMQFRKVCNHPELFERREPRLPFSIAIEDYTVPRLVTDDGLLHLSISSLNHLKYNLLSVFNPHHIHRSVFGDSPFSCFSFARILGLSTSELHNLVLGGLLFRIIHIMDELRKRERRKLIPKNNLILEDVDLPGDLAFTSRTMRVYGTGTIEIHSTPEALEHRILRSRKALMAQCGGAVVVNVDQLDEGQLLPEFQHIPQPPLLLTGEPLTLPGFIEAMALKVEARKSREFYSSSRSWAWTWDRHTKLENEEGAETIVYGSPELAKLCRTPSFFPTPSGGLLAARPIHGWSNIIIPDKQTLVTDAGKLHVLDGLLTRLKQQGHRALIYSQMTRMIDILEEYMGYKKHSYMRLDGSSKISDRRDMVADFQNRADIFVFLLSTRAGGLGINLTAADTVIFYDSDWNPTVDQQAMDRAHRLGQTKQVTVYRLICKGTIEERILQRAQEKSEIQRMVISGGNFKPDTLKPKEVVSLLLDDAEIEEKYRQKQAEKKLQEESRLDRERKRKSNLSNYKDSIKHIKTEDGGVVEVYEGVTSSASPSLPATKSEQPDPGNEAVASSSAVSFNVSQTATGCPPIVNALKQETRPLPKKLLTPERMRSKRGRPPRGTLRGGLSRPSVSGMPPIALGTSLTGSSSASLKRRPGRPRLKPMGPNHFGGRGSSVSAGGGGTSSVVRRPSIGGGGTSTTTTAATTGGGMLHSTSTSLPTTVSNHSPQPPHQSPPAATYCLSHDSVD